jgi:hypothetical protein
MLQCPSLNDSTLSVLLLIIIIIIILCCGGGGGGGGTTVHENALRRTSWQLPTKRFTTLCGQTGRMDDGQTARCLFQTFSVWYSTKDNK